MSKQTLEDFDPQKAYKILVPRLTTIITTINSKREVNAAPFSAIMPVSNKPSILAFACVPTHDTYRNISDVGEFVVNIPPADIMDEMWVTARKFPYGVDELLEAGLTEIPSVKVSSPRIDECAAHLECEVKWIQESGDHNLIGGEIVHMTVKTEALKKDVLNVEQVKPLLHLDGVDFVIGDQVRKIKR